MKKNCSNANDVSKSKHPLYTRFNLSLGLIASLSLASPLAAQQALPVDLTGGENVTVDTGGTNVGSVSNISGSTNTLTLDAVTIEMSQGVTAVSVGNPTTPSHNNTISNNADLSTDSTHLITLRGDGNTINNANTLSVQNSGWAVAVLSGDGNVVNNTDTISGDPSSAAIHSDSSAAIAVASSATGTVIYNTGAITTSGSGQAAIDASNLYALTQENAAAVIKSDAGNAVYIDHLEDGGSIALNSGSVDAYSTGVYINNIDGSATINLGAAITAGSIGFQANHSLGNDVDVVSLTNSGSITASTGYGMRINGIGLGSSVANTGSITASGGGSLGNDHGVYIAGNNLGTIDNSGTISATAEGASGIYVSGDSMHITGTNGIINSDSHGIYVDGLSEGGSINLTGGSITVNNGDGIHVDEGGFLGSTAQTIANGSNITVNGVGNGLFVGTDLNGPAGVTLSNSGTITTTEGEGIRVNGSIGGLGTGVVSNTGTINATGGGGITVESVYAGSSISNSGSITTNTGNFSGIEVSLSMDGTITNSGNIDSNYNGIYIGAASTGDITNSSLISVANSGIYVNGTIDDIDSSGIIVASNGYGIYVGGNAGDVTGNSITSWMTGIDINGNADSVSSDDDIRSNTGDGVNVAGNVTGSVDVNDITALSGYGLYVGGNVGGDALASGTIRSANDGIYVNGNVGGNVGGNTMAITASGATSDGIDIDGNVTGTISADSISAGNDGINAMGTVNASGLDTDDAIAFDTITATNGYGIYTDGAVTGNIAANDSGVDGTSIISESTGIRVNSGGVTGNIGSSDLIISSTSGLGISVTGNVGGNIAADNITAGGGDGVFVDGNVGGTISVAVTDAAHSGVYIAGTVNASGLDTDNAIAFDTITADDGYGIHTGDTVTGNILATGVASSINSTNDGIHIVGSVTGNIGASGMAITSTTGDGIDVAGNVGGTITAESLTAETAAADGIRIGLNALDDITVTTITAGNDGIHIGGSAENITVETISAANGFGIYTGSAAGNIVANNVDSNYSGVFVNSGATSVASDDHITVNGTGFNFTHNLDGVYVNGALNNFTVNNISTQNGSGVYVAGNLGLSGSPTESNIAGAINAGAYGVYVGGNLQDRLDLASLASIQSVNDGIHIAGASSGGIVSAAGSTIVSTEASGIVVEQSNTAAIHNGASIDAFGHGITVGTRDMAYENNSNIFNSGSIYSETGIGIWVIGNNTGAAAIIRNSGSIIVDIQDGIQIWGNNAQTIDNSGNIGTLDNAVGGAGIRVTGVNSGIIRNGAPGFTDAIIHATMDAIIVGENSTGGTITNIGTLLSDNGSGIHVVSDNQGHIENATGASITASINGIHVQGDNLAGGTILNDATITAQTGCGMRVQGDNVGSVTNDVNGTIAAAQDGIFVGGLNSSSISNSGQIGTATTAVGDNGIQVVSGNSGTIQNADTGSIYATNDAILVGENSTGGTITNDGSLTSHTANGIHVTGNNSSNITNDVNGTIAAAQDGILVGGVNTLTIYNIGQIGTATTAVGDNGIQVVSGNSGLIQNAATGVIYATNDGILLGSTAEGAAAVDNNGEITNYGSLTSHTANGIHVTGNNSDYISNMGTIAAAQDGILVGGLNSSYVSNFGQIGTATTAVGDNGIQVVSGNSSHIQNGSSSFSGANIYATNDGILLGSTAEGAAAVDNNGLVGNYGALTSHTANGIHITGNNSHTIINDVNGTIAAAQDGILVGGLNSSSISNFGQIGTSTTAVGANGIHVTGNNGSESIHAEIINQGTISAALDGILIDGNNLNSYVYNLAGSIAAGEDGIHVSGTNGGTILNTASIGSTTTSVGDNGIQVIGQNNATIANHGYVYATNDAILLGSTTEGAAASDNNGEIVSDGNLYSATGSGIHVTGDNLVSILTDGGIINVALDGIHVDGSNNNAQDLYNDATINAGENGIYVAGNNISEGDITRGDIINAGVINAGDDGIHVAGSNVGGSIYNQATIGNSTTPVGDNGIQVVAGNSGTIENRGGLYAANDGILLGDTAEGAAAADNSGIIGNTGGLYSTVGNGIHVTGNNTASGSLSNTSTAYVLLDGILVDGANAGAIQNTSALISSSGSSIHLVSGNSGTVVNVGTASSADDTILIGDTLATAPAADNSGTILNQGVLTSSVGDGIHVTGSNSATGRIENSAVIDNHADGIQVEGGNAGTILNGGSNSASYPILITVSEDAILVGSTADGALAAHNTGTIENAGILSSHAASGIHVTGSNSGETALINNTATIDADENGIVVDMDNTSGSRILNSGSILVVGEDGIHIGVTNSGSISNSGLITVNTGQGIEVAAANVGTVQNSGTITANSAQGILVGNGNSGTIYNTTEANIIAETNGIQVGGFNTETALINNSGNIIADGGAGVLIGQSNNGAIVNSDTASISSGSGSVYVTVNNNGRIVNQGSMDAGSDVVFVGGTNSMVISNSGSINSSGFNGIQVLSGNSGLILNDSAEDTPATIDADMDGIHVESGNSGLIYNIGGQITANNGISVTGSNAGILSEAMLEALGGEISATVATIQNTGNINAGNVGIRVAGVNGDAEGNGSIENSGTIIAIYHGISVEHGNAGTITNFADGVIQTEDSGITVGNADLSGNSGTITNAGTVETDLDGISVHGNNSGTVVNTATGTVDTVFPAIAIINGHNTGSIQNAGELITDNIAAIYVNGNNAGSIQNAATGTINVQNGDGIAVLVDNAHSTGDSMIRNDGTITVSSDGIFVAGDNGADINDAIYNTGTIDAGDNGVFVGGDNVGRIFNYGMIGSETEPGDNGVYVEGTNSGSIYNYADGEIISTEESIYVNGANSGYITNAGSIESTAGDGINVSNENSGNIINAATGGIVSDDQGIVTGDNSGTILNDGAIDSGDEGIYADGENSGLIASNGTITATTQGISIDGANSGTVGNSGEINAGRAGIQTGNNTADGLIENSGELNAATFGMVVFDGNAGTVSNTTDGSITASVGIAVALGNSGAVSNAGSITAGFYGVGIEGDNSGSMNNSGSIEANLFGIAVTGNNTLGATISNNGTINAGLDGSVLPGDAPFESAVDGIYVQAANAGTISNSGSLTATGSGVLIASGNSGMVMNSGSIVAGVNGLHVQGVNSGTLTNGASDATNATIDATENGIASEGPNSGTIQNYGSIAAGANGIYASVNTGSIYNRGSIGSSETSIGESGISVDGDNTGGIYNITGASIYATESAIIIAGNNTSLESIDNDGLLVSDTGDGIYLGGDNTGAIRNTVNGTIEAAESGIYVAGANSGEDSIIVNAGTITAESRGIYVGDTNDGGILNTGTIASGTNGILVGGDSNAIENTGTVTSADTGILAGGTSATILNSGTITAGAEGGTAIAGISVTGNAETITNTGTIASSGFGIHAATDAATIANSGSITAGVTGVLVDGSTGSFTNTTDGSITGDLAGVRLMGGATGDIINNGSVTGDEIGFNVNSNVVGSITNTGSINTTSEAYSEGLTVIGTVGGSITNTGSVNGNTVGIGVTGMVTGTVSNSGTINSSNGGAIDLVTGADSVINTGTLTGRGGIAAGTTVNGITNSGTINTTAFGILSPDSDITNTGTITVTGENAIGVSTFGENVITNSGTVAVSGTDSVGILLAAGNVTLQNSGTIVSDADAIASSGGDTIAFSGASNVTGNITNYGVSDSALVFGAVLDVEAETSTQDSAFNMAYSGSATGFDAFFAGGNTTFDGADATSSFRDGATQYGAVFNVNSTVEFSGEGSLISQMQDRGILDGAPLSENTVFINMGTLAGNGTLVLRNSTEGLGELLSSGTLAPEDLTVDGNVNIDLGTLELGVSANGSGDHLMVTSTVDGENATLTFAEGTSINLVSNATTAEFLPGNTFSIISLEDATLVVEGTSSQFNLIDTTDNLTDYRFYTIGDVARIENVSTVYAVAARDHAFDRFAENNSQSVVGAYLNNQVNNADFDELLLSLNLIPGNDAFNHALELMSGEIYPSLVVLEQQRITELMEGVANSLRPIDCAMPQVVQRNAWYAFAQANSSTSDASDGKVADIDSEYYGMFAGVGCRINSTWDAGGFINLAEGEASNNHPDTADTSNYDFGLYARYNHGGDYYYGAFTYGAGEYDVDRFATAARSHLLVSQAQETAIGNTDSTYWSAYLEKGYTFEMGESVLQPFAAFQYTQLEFDRFTETGAGLLNLNVDFDDWTSMRTLLGGKWEYRFNSTYSLQMRAVWTHEFEDEAAYMNASLAGTSDSFYLQGIELGTDWFTISLGANARFNNKFSVYAAGNYTTSSEQDVQAANIGLLYEW
ncbi:MAG: hypothetical protein JW739_04740 [Opitutales bacterium]|nr:hypothetical protein [Opitutales bacterium]